MIRRILNILYSLWFNLRYLPFEQALRMPVLISLNVKVLKLKRGQLIIEKANFHSVLLGSGKSPAMNASKSHIYICDGGSIIFKGRTVISEGTVLRCDHNAKILFGDNFYCNCNCYFRSTNLISFGNNCTLGWNITINTSDGHHVWHNDKEVKMEAPINVGNHVWLAPNCSLTKNSLIADNCIVTQKAVVTKQFYEPNCLIGGIPAKVLSENINWKN